MLPPLSRRVDDLIARMTLDEKIAQITAVWDGKVEIFDDKLQLDHQAAGRYPAGLGQFTRPSDAKGSVSPRGHGRDPAQTVALVNALQHWATTQRGWASRSCSMKKGCMVMPPSAPPASAEHRHGVIWDPDMLRAVNGVIAREIRARRVAGAGAGGGYCPRPALGPDRGNLWRGPLSGRRNGRRGGGRPARARPCAPTDAGHVFATLKHLTGHGQPESGTNVGPAPISERELRENFFPPFEQVVKRTGIEAVMASYNEIDGVPPCQQVAAG
jgi:beta-glucosidase